MFFNSAGEHPKEKLFSSTSEFDCLLSESEPSKQGIKWTYWFSCAGEHPKENVLLSTSEFDCYGLNLNPPSKASKGLTCFFGKGEIV